MASRFVPVLAAALLVGAVQAQPPEAWRTDLGPGVPPGQSVGVRFVPLADGAVGVTVESGPDGTTSTVVRRVGPSGDVWAVSIGSDPGEVAFPEAVGVGEVAVALAYVPPDDDRALRVVAWDAATGAEAFSVRVPDIASGSGTARLAVSPDGGVRLGVGDLPDDAGGALVALDARGVETWRVDRAGAEARAVEVGRDGTTYVAWAGVAGGDLLTYDEDGVEVADLTPTLGGGGVRESPMALALAPDGDVVVVFEAATGSDYTAAVVRMAPDGAVRWERRYGVDPEGAFLSVGPSRVALGVTARAGGRLQAEVASWDGDGGGAWAAPWVGTRRLTGVSVGAVNVVALAETPGGAAVRGHSPVGAVEWTVPLDGFGGVGVAARPGGRAWVQRTTPGASSVISAGADGLVTLSERTPAVRSRDEVSAASGRPGGGIVVAGGRADGALVATVDAAGGEGWSWASTVAPPLAAVGADEAGVCAAGRSAAGTFVVWLGWDGSPMAEGVVGEPGDVVGAAFPDGGGGCFVAGTTGAGGLFASRVAGGAVAWRREVAGDPGPSGTGGALAGAAAVGGGIVVAGSLWTAPDDLDYAVAVWDAEGAESWRSGYDDTPGPFDIDIARGVAVGDGAVVVTGRVGDEFASDDAVTVAFDGATGDRLWAARLGGPGVQDGRAVTSLPGGGVAVAFIESASAAGVGTRGDLAAAAYSVAGDELWRGRAPLPGRDDVQSVAVDASGTVYVGGRAERRPDPSDVVAAFSAGGQVAFVVEQRRLPFAALAPQPVLVVTGGGGDGPALVTTRSLAVPGAPEVSESIRVTGLRTPGAVASEPSRRPVAALRVFGSPGPHPVVVGGTGALELYDIGGRRVWRSDSVGGVRRLPSVAPGVYVVREVGPTGSRSVVVTVVR